MKVNLSKNKLLLINSLIIIISFIVFFAYLHKVNYDFYDYGNKSVLKEILDNLKNLTHLSSPYLANFSKKLFLGIVPLLLIVVDIIYIIWLIISFILGLNQKRNKEVKYNSLLFLSRIYLLSIIYYCAIDSIYYISYRINDYYSTKMLFPIIGIALYNLISIAIFNSKDLKKELKKISNN